MHKLPTAQLPACLSAAALATPSPGHLQGAPGKVAPGGPGQAKCSVCFSGLVVFQSQEGNEDEH